LSEISQPFGWIITLELLQHLQSPAFISVLKKRNKRKQILDLKMRTGPHWNIEFHAAKEDLWTVMTNKMKPDSSKKFAEEIWIHIQVDFDLQPVLCSSRKLWNAPKYLLLVLNVFRSLLRLCLRIYFTGGTHYS
jgi:hypothetical protein